MSRFVLRLPKRRVLALTTAGLAAGAFAIWATWPTLTGLQRSGDLSAVSNGVQASGVGLDPRERFRRATEAISANDQAQANSQIEALSKAPGFEPHVGLLQSALLMRAGRLEEAVQGFGRAAEHEELRAQAYAYLGEALLRTTRAGNAQKALHEALQRDPHCTDAHRWLAVLYYDLGAMESALAHLREVGRLAPHDPRPYRLMGRIHKDYERFDLAVPDYQECLRRNPEQADASQIRLELAQCQAKLLRHAQAIETTQMCEPTADVHIVRAECYRALNRRDEARDCLKRALTAAPQHLEALLLKGAMALEDSDAKAARDALAVAVEHYPKDDVAHYRLALAYNKLGESLSAERHLQLAAELKEKRLKFSELNEQAMQRPADAELRYQIGLLARELDKPELATSWFRAALAIDPLHEGALGEIQKLGNL